MKNLVKSGSGILTSIGESLHVVAICVSIGCFGKIDRLMLASETVLHKRRVYLNTQDVSPGPDVI